MTPEEHAVALALARADLYSFSRFMFLARRGFKWQRAQHHKTICSALMRVYAGECKRLIINIPPRYSKCSVRGTLVRMENGVKDIAEIRAGDIVLSFDGGKLVERKVRATESFRKKCVTVRSRSGRDLRVSHDHPVLTQRGWVAAAELTADHYLIRLCSEIDGLTRIPDAELDFVALMLFEGGCSSVRNIRFTSADADVVAAFRESCGNLGVAVKQYPSNQAIDYNVMGGASGRAAGLLERYGQLGCLAKNKRLPKVFFDLPLDQKYRFLSLMFATDGYVIKRHSQLAIALASEGLIDDISLLLDSCGVPNRKYSKPNAFAGAWELVIGASHIERLAGKVNLLHKQADFEAALGWKNRESTVFGYPYEAAKGLTLKCKNAQPKIDFKHRGVMISDAKLRRMIKEIDPSLVRWEMQDFIYDRVAGVTASGEDDVFHLEIDADEYDQKNYIASGYVVHNTELAVVNFMSWALGRNPDAEFIHTSYSGRLASSNAWQARELVTHETYREIFPRVELRDDSKARDEWRTTLGGCVYAVGAGGTITGYGAGKMRSDFGGALILDDPHKPDEIRSDIMRKGVIEWFQNTLESRKNSPETPIVLIMQRLHEEDLAGWLLAGGNGETWDHISLPAIQADGTALWPDKHTIDDLRRMQDAAPFTFSGQYQQAPTPLEGGIFRPDQIAPVDAAPGVVDSVRAWDLAASHDDGDWTVGALLGRMPASGRIVIGDIVRLRGRPDEVEAAIVSTANRDGRRVTISLPQDPGQAGKAQIAYLTKALIGYVVKSSPETGDKVTRAEPFASQVNVGNVDMVRAEWNGPMIAEMRNFPNGKFDDQIDAASRGFNHLSSSRGDMRISDSAVRLLAGRR